VDAAYDPDAFRSYGADGEDDEEFDESEDASWSWETDHHPVRTAATVSSTEVYASPWLSLREDSVRRPDGSTQPYAVVDMVDAALIIAAEEGRLYLVEQYRYPIAGRSWEFPSGSADPQRDADPWALAARELREETGLAASTLTPLGTLDIMPSTLSQRCWVFLATDLDQGPPDRDADENDMESGWFTRDHVERMIRNGHITDAKSCAAYTLLLLHEQAHTMPPAGPLPAPTFLRRRSLDI
jgi:8-oxo-dGTP pyrophosphatase MutT (NUDIX family)